MFVFRERAFCSFFGYLEFLLKNRTQFLIHLWSSISIPFVSLLFFFYFLFIFYFFLQNIIISVLSLFTMLKAIYLSLHSEFVKQHVTYTSIGNHVLKKNNLKSKSGLKLIHIFLPLKFYPRDFKQIRISYSPGNVLTCYFGFI